eukprot:Lithocolla_globosa_v1_NODE_3535_length_1644_cov_125.396476.p1 type:complete len:451 gc:universal NODE_3535_length_1644_cov_125.396476:1375-23(-)
MSVVTQSLDYQQKSVSHPTYQLSKNTPQTGSTTVTITTSGGQESIFEISPKVMNLSKSILSFTSTPVASGANKRNFVHIDGVSLIRTIQLYTRTGVYLCDINDLNKYMKMTMRQSHAIDDVMTFDKNLNGNGYFEGLRTNNSPTATSADATRPTANECNTLITEPSYLTVGTANDASPVVNYQLPLGRIVNSILSIDKDQYFGEIMYLRIVWAPSTQAVFTAESDTNPTTTTGAYGGNLTVSNLTLYTALEQNQVINNELMTKYNNGSLSYLVPYIYQNKQLLSNTQQNLSVKYNIAHGRKLKKLLISPFHTADSGQNCYNNDNLADAKVLDYYTMINNVRTSQFNYDTSAGDDWLAKKHLFKGSCIQSSNEYYYNFVIVEDFTALTKPGMNTDNLDDGLDLSQEIKFDLVMVTSPTASGTGPNVSDINHHIYAITQKKLTLSPNGPVLV